MGKKTTRRCYPRTYALLKGVGFSPYKVLEIINDAKRTDKLAINVVKAFRRRSRQKTS